MRVPLIAAPALALLCALTLLSPAAAEEPTDEAQPEGWQIASDINLTLTQNAYSENWSGDETGSISWALNSNTTAESQLSETMNTKSTLKLSFGQTHTQDSETKVWARPIKSTDLVDLESVLRFTYGWAVDPFVAGRVQTQFLDKSDTLKTRLLNPALFTESAGVARMLLKDEKREWSVRLGGAVRQHLDRDALPENSDVRENVITNDGGLEFVSSVRTPLAGGAITWTSDLNIFQALYYSESDKLKGQPGADDWKSP
ncbi:MAG: DUF3078 domain-containing protein, partial [Candidatus Eisenbacteria bacterium]|nr:DUF3078 domain-containing protein [Candidatus Eisenbacteria bacterium]